MIEVGQEGCLVRLDHFERYDLQRAMFRTVLFGPVELFFPSYALAIEEINGRREESCSGLLESNNEI